MERYRRGKAHRARTGSVNVLSGAPFGYRYLRKTDHAGAGYEIVEHEAALVARAVPPLRRRRRLHRRPGPLADRPGRAHPHRQDPLGPRPWSGACCATPPTPGRPSSARPRPSTNPRASTAAPAWQGRTTPRASKTVDRPREEWIAHPRPGDHHRRDLRAGRAAAGRQQALRLPQQQGPVPAAGPGRLLGLRIRLLPHLDPHHQQEDLLLPVPGQRRLPLRRRAGLRQQAGPRRLPRPGRLGPHHRPARRPAPDPRRDRQAPRHRPHRRPRHPAAQTPGDRPWPRPPPRSPA